MEEIRKILIKILFLGFLLFAMYIVFMFVKGNKQFKARAYKGVITNIRKPYFNRGLPDIKIHDEWIPFSIDDSKVMNYIQIGDSIIKNSGSREITVYRKDKKDEWIGKIFK